MPGLDGSTLRSWRRARGWDVPETARQLRRAASGPVAGHDGLIRMIRGWERGDHELSERYELLYRRLGLTHSEDVDEPGPHVPRPRLTRGDSVPRPAQIDRQEAGAEPLALMLTVPMAGSAPEGAQASPDVAALASDVNRARRLYQACRYSELISGLPRLLPQLHTACLTLDGDARLRAYALTADAYHVTAGFLLKVDDYSLAHLAADRSMHAALASGDLLTVGASARIVTHTLMNSGHHAAAISTARSHCLRLDREIAAQTPESLSVYGSVLLRGAIAAAQHGERGTAHDMLAEADDAAHRLGVDANLRGTAFGPVNARLHHVTVAVTLGDAGTAIEVGRRIDLTAVTVTERKASLLIDTAHAFFQWGRYQDAYAALRAADQAAPEEVAARPSVSALARDLAAFAPAGIRRDAGEFASRLGKSW